MHRRRFLKDSLLGLSSSAIAAALLGTEPWNESGREKFTVDYIRKEAPPFEIPPNRGQRYVDTVPDTVDIAEQSKLAIHALTSIYRSGSGLRNPCDR